MAIELSAKKLLLLTVGDVEINYNSNAKVSDLFIERYVRNLGGTIVRLMNVGKESRRDLVTVEFPSGKNHKTWDNLFYYDEFMGTFSCIEGAKFQIKNELEYAFFDVPESINRVILGRLLKRKSNVEIKREKMLAVKKPVPTKNQKKVAKVVRHK